MAEKKQAEKQNTEKAGVQEAIRENGEKAVEAFNTSNCKNFNPFAFAIKLDDNENYLEVKYRIIWFKMQNPQSRIITEIVNKDEYSVVMKASVFETAESPVPAASAYCERTYANGINSNISPLEWAETIAVGRALSFAGYGTVCCGNELTDDKAQIAELGADNNSSGELEKAIEELRPQIGDKVNPQILKLKSFNGYTKGKAISEILQMKNAISVLDWLSKNAVEVTPEQIKTKAAVILIKEWIEKNKTETE